jgi:hypothetical protein
MTFSPGTPHHGGHGTPSSIREIQESQARPVALQTPCGCRKIGKPTFEAAVAGAAQRRLIDDLLALFGGRTQPVMAHLIESGKLTLDDVQAAERTLKEMATKENRDDIRA